MPASRFARTAAVLTACGIAAALSTGAAAQNCKLSVQASPNVISSGQTSHVDVFGSFPTSVYAFASAQFDVESTDPMWLFASSGAIVGNDVLGINISQSHLPQVGVLADPTNPLRIWTGEIMPAVAGPALVQVHADPASFWYYPSKLTSSPAQGVPVGGSDFIFVNPLVLNGIAFAPGQGTQVSISDDVIVDGKIITAENYDSILIGMLVPAVMKVREATRVGTDQPPEVFTAGARAIQRSRVTSLAVTFDSQVSFDRSNTGDLYAINADLEGEGMIAFSAFSGGVRVAGGDLNGPEGDFLVGAVPDSVDIRVGTGNLSLAAANTYSMLNWSFRFDKPVKIKFFSGKVLTADTLNVSRRIPAGEKDKAGSVNLGWQTFRVKGAQSLTLKPGRF